MIALAVIPSPTATLALVCHGRPVGSPAAVDLVCDSVEGKAYVLVPLAEGVVYRLEFTLPQLGALMDELVDLADTAERQQAAGPAEWGAHG